MRGLLSLTLALAVTTTTARADEPAEVRAILDKAVQAAGGEANLARARTYTQKATGKFFGPARPVAFTGEWVVNLPAQVREAIEAESDGMKFRAVKVIDGDKGWLRVNNGSAEELDKDALAEAREQLYALDVATLLPLKEKEYTLAALGESKVGERPAVGVKVTRPGRPAVSLSFDKEKGWLLRVEFSAPFRKTSARWEIVYDDYHDVGGLKRPKKTTIRRDGKVFVESEVTEFKPLDKVDAKQFEKP